MEDFLQILPSNGGIERLRFYNFGGPFDWNWLSDIQQFFHTRKHHPEYEFLEPDLERLRKELLRSINVFLRLLSDNTSYTEGTWARVRVDSETEMPAWFWKIVEEINRAAEET